MLTVLSGTIRVLKCFILSAKWLVNAEIKPVLAAANLPLVLSTIDRKISGSFRVEKNLRLSSK